MDVAAGLLAEEESGIDGDSLDERRPRFRMGHCVSSPGSLQPPQTIGQQRSVLCVEGVRQSKRAILASRDTTGPCRRRERTGSMRP